MNKIKKIIRRKIMIWLTKALRNMLMLDSPGSYDIVLYQKTVDWLNVQKEAEAE